MTGSNMTAPAKLRGGVGVLGASALTALCLGGTPAFADLSAEQVWADWQAYAARLGYELRGDEAMADGTLTVSDVTLAVTLPEEEGSMIVTYPRLSFTDTGTGTVRLTLPDSAPVTARIDSPDAEEVDMALRLESDGFAMVASGSPEDLTYTYVADRMALALTELVVEDEVIEVETARMAVAGLDGTSAVGTGALRQSTQTVETGAVEYEIDFTDPEEGGRVKLAGGAAGTRIESEGTYPADVDTEDMNAMLDAGFRFDADFAHRGGTLGFDFEEGREAVQFNSVSEAGGLRVALNEGGLAYEMFSEDAQLDVAGSDVPFPVEIAMARNAVSLLMPVRAREAEQDFAFGFTLADFTMSDMIWDIFDAEGRLPRDPATLNIGLTGTARVLADLLDPDAMESFERDEALPAELTRLGLETLLLRAAGAELSGSGSFTFDNSDTETFDGFPAPDGAVDLEIVGVNGLLDRLIAMGLLPEEQASGARMMMGLFAVPGAGEDTLTSRIEVRPNGQILANGQRLQ